MLSPLITPETLTAICGSDKILLAELMSLFQEETPKQLETLGKALAEKAYDRIKLAAHTLKGSASYVGASAMVHLCQSLEQAASSQEEALCHNILVELQLNFPQTEQALKAAFGL